MRAMGRRGMVASPHYLATGAGLNVLRRGGNAVDAAVATNAVLAVVTPYMCGIGGDLFAQVYWAADDRLTGLNGSGRAPSEATPERMRELAGGDQIPARGPLPITVPGCVDAWGRLHDRFGHLPLRYVLADAISYARDGFPVTAAFARSMEMAAGFLHPDTPARETFLPGGEPPREGQVLVQARIARTLGAIAEEGPEVFYCGWVADEIVQTVRSTGGVLALEDMARHRSAWVEPLEIRYRDVTVYELPPNSQGIIALIALGILDQLPMQAIREGGDEYVHLLAEAARLAYADRARHITDPEQMRIEPAELIAPERLRDLATRVGQSASAPTLTGTPADTIYLCAADQAGNMVSMIESNWMGIGSGVMGGESGVMLQNRGNWFSLDPSRANVIAPNKRTMHTLMPGMAFRESRPWLAFGTMGGSGQAQIHVELLTRLIDQRAQLDEAIDAPRFDAVVGAGPGGRPIIQLESRFPPETLEGLERRGHALRTIEPYSFSMGHAHAILRSPDGTYIGAADPRADSLALGY